MTKPKPKPRAGAQKPRRATKTPEVRPEPSALVPQPHGGALWQGAPANPVAGPGRPANALREAMRGNLAAVIPKLHELWIAGKIDGIQYAQLLAKYTLDARTKGISWADAESMTQDLAEAIRRRVPPEHYTPELADELSAIARRYQLATE